MSIRWWRCLSMCGRMALPPPPPPSPPLRLPTTSGRGFRTRLVFPLSLPGPPALPDLLGQLAAPRPKTRLPPFPPTLQPLSSHPSLSAARSVASVAAHLLLCAVRFVPLTYLSVCLSVCLSVHLSACLSVCPSVCLSVCLSVFLSCFSGSVPLTKGTSFI